MLRKRVLIFLSLFLALFLVSQGFEVQETPVYLTYSQDPATSITVQWHSEKPLEPGSVKYREKGKDSWREQKGSFVQAGVSSTYVHQVTLTDLSPKTYYEFSIGDDAKTYLFRTLPSSLDQDSIRFVVGGDAYRSLARFQKTNQKIAKKDPDFIVVGGDIAYTDSKKAPFQGRLWEIKRWKTFFTEWFTTMRGSDGRLIPIVAVVGNHDVPKNFKDPNKEPILFYQMFAFPKGPISYRCIDVGSYLSLLLLDTDHSYPIIGDQTKWLKNALLTREKTPYKMAVYHISAYPSVYPYNGRVAKKIRDNWSPLFEQYNVRFAFENHNHAYKRTFPIKQENISEDGVVYIGDGSWGVTPRKTHARAWYLEKKAKINSFNLVELSAKGCEVLSYSSTGKMIDKAPIWLKE